MTLRVPFQMPTATTPIVGVGKSMEKAWFVFLYSVYNAITKGLTDPEEVVTPDASPSVYTAIIRGQLFVAGGTVSALEYSRNGRDWYPTTSPVQMAAGDQARISYSVVPSTVVYVPL
jgi:hypothetical protein